MDYVQNQMNPTPFGFNNITSVSREYKNNPNPYNLKALFLYCLHNGKQKKKVKK